MSRRAVQIENILLRSQLALIHGELETGKRSKLKSTWALRMIWVLYSRLFDNWDAALMLYARKTVTSWHRSAFKIYWKNKFIKRGRPSIRQETINLILEIHKANSLWSPERIHQQLILLNVKDPPAPNTIRKYLSFKKPPSSHGKRRAWYTFYQNHAEEIWGADFFTVPTLSSRILYVLVIIHHGTRRIVQTAVTDSPYQFWLTQQFRNADSI